MLLFQVTNRMAMIRIVTAAIYIVSHWLMSHSIVAAAAAAVVSCRLISCITPILHCFCLRAIKLMRIRADECVRVSECEFICYFLTKESPEFDSYVEYMTTML